MFVSSSLSIPIPIPIPSMAAIRRIIASNKTLSPYLLTFTRGIAFKLFVGAKVVTDRVSAKSKGFGFVTFASQDEAENAMAEMNGKALNGRVIFVDYAKPDTKTGFEMPIARGPPEDRNQTPTVDSPQAT